MIQTLWALFHEHPAIPILSGISWAISFAATLTHYCDSKANDWKRRKAANKVLAAIAIGWAAIPIIFTICLYWIVSALGLTLLYVGLDLGQNIKDETRKITKARLSAKERKASKLLQDGQLSAPPDRGTGNLSLYDDIEERLKEKR